MMDLLKDMSPDEQKQFRARMNERGADMPPDEIYPSEAEVAAYRARHITF